jgi:hypothetical protein
MGKRVTVMIEDTLDKKIRLIQSKLIVNISNSVSYSSVINQLLRKELKQIFRINYYFFDINLDRNHLQLC